MRAVRFLLGLAAIAVVAVGLAWLRFSPHAPPAPVARIHDLIEDQRRDVRRRAERRREEAEFQRSLPSRVTLLRRELTEPGLYVSRVAGQRAGGDERLVYITGEVRRQGSYTLADGMTLIQVVEAAGGFTERADRNRIHVMRAVEGKTMTLDARPEDRLLADDVIQVIRRINGRR